ncbi:MAG TPA: hypothetical protein VFQ54_00530 [Thermomicrobiales bacterium]|nr:hypothetical protein [Thermomicrobiales bacterium]
MIAHSCRTLRKFHTEFEARCAGKPLDLFQRGTHLAAEAAADLRLRHAGDLGDTILTDPLPEQLDAEVFNYPLSA